eukprot:3276364-Karenia_brevis.AAC.1
MVQPYLASLPCYIMGFRLGFQVLMMVDALRLLLYKAAEWRRPLLVAQTDVEAAFESLDHAHVVSGWRKLEVPTVFITALYREMLGTSVQVVIGGHRANSDEMEDLIEGGRPGDVATPRHWNVTIFLILDPLLHQWRQRGWGVHLGSDTLLLLNWADDFVLVATSLNIATDAAGVCRDDG